MSWVEYLKCELNIVNIVNKIGKANLTKHTLHLKLKLIDIFGSK